MKKEFKRKLHLFRDSGDGELDQNDFYLTLANVRYRVTNTIADFQKTKTNHNNMRIHANHTHNVYNFTRAC